MNMETFNNIFIAVLWILMTLSATIGSATISPKRTYYPVLRILLGFIAFVGGYYGMGGVLRIWYPELISTFVYRIFPVAALAGAMLWTAIFIHRRNNHPQYIVIDARGLSQYRDQDELVTDLENKLLDVASAVRHDIINVDAAVILHQALQERKAKKKSEGTYDTDNEEGKK
jgi:hypothetical protein